MIQLKNAALLTTLECGMFECNMLQLYVDHPTLDWCMFECNMLQLYVDHPTLECDIFECNTLQLYVDHPTLISRIYLQLSILETRAILYLTFLYS